MAGPAANITSTVAVRQMKAALVQFGEELADVLTMFELESRQALEWIENDRGRYWPTEERKAADQVIEARLAVERCELTSAEDTKKSCLQEKKDLEKAKRRLRLCEEKIQLVKHYKQELRKEVEEFQVQLAKGNWYLDSDFLKALAALDKMAAALDRYLQTTGGGTSVSPPVGPSKPAAESDSA